MCVSDVLGWGSGSPCVLHAQNRAWPPHDAAASSARGRRAAPGRFVPVRGPGTAPGCLAAFTDGEPLRSRVCCEAWQGLTPKPHAPFDGVGPTSPNLKRHPGLSVRPGRKEPRWPRTPCAGSSRRRRGSACQGRGFPWGAGAAVPVSRAPPALWSPVPGAPPRRGIPP